MLGGTGAGAIVTINSVEWMVVRTLRDELSWGQAEQMTALEESAGAGGFHNYWMDGWIDNEKAAGPVARPEPEWRE